MGERRGVESSWCGARREGLRGEKASPPEGSDSATSDPKMDKIADSVSLGCCEN